MNPLVSVVIPTKNRPDLVIRAVESALRQTWSNIEVLVVVDGPDPASIKALHKIRDTRLQIIALNAGVGGSDARNIGTQRASGTWIALLDDDDEFLPEKLTLQLEAADNSSAIYPIVTCRLHAIRKHGTEIWPRARFVHGQDLSEYLFSRSSPRQGEGFIQTSTLLIPRDMLLRCPFKSGLNRHQDWDWLLAVNSLPDAKIEWVWTPLVNYDLVTASSSISRTKSWHDSYEWAETHSKLTRKAFAYFVATQIAPKGVSLSSLPLLLKATFRYPRALLFAALFFLTSSNARSHLLSANASSGAN